MSKAKSNYKTVGSLIWQSNFDENNKPIPGDYKTDEAGRKLFALRLSKDVKITIDGVDMTGKTLYLSNMENVNNGKLQRGVIDQEEYDKKVQDYGPDGKLEFVRYEVTAKLS
jgi:hypothetical protein